MHATILRGNQGRLGSPPQAARTDVRQARALDGKLGAITAAIQQPPVPPDLGKGTPQSTPKTYGPIVATSAGSRTTTLAPTTTQAPTSTVPTDASNSPDQGGDDDSGQGSSGETATTLP